MSWKVPNTNLQNEWLAMTSTNNKATLRGNCLLSTETYWYSSNPDLKQVKIGQQDFWRFWFDDFQVNANIFWNWVKLIES